MSKGKKSFADIVASMENDLRRKVAGKIPSWQQMEVPTALSYEQCSSEATAAYKTRFIRPGSVVADLTGGLGVDSAAFASAGARVCYFEQNSELCAAAARNFEAMGLGGSISVTNTTVGADTPLPDCDLIFMDPARRSDIGRKVFLLEDCTPNVLELLPVLWKHTGRMLLKLSPMADVTLIARRLAAANCDILGHSGLREIHIVETGGEVKELLVYMERDFCGGFEREFGDGFEREFGGGHEGDSCGGFEREFGDGHEGDSCGGYEREYGDGYEGDSCEGREMDSFVGMENRLDDGLERVPVTATNLRESFTFTPEQEAAATAHFASAEPGKYIFVPSGALLKAGAFNILGFPRLSPDSHLYVCDAPQSFGRSYLIEQVLPFSSSAIRELSGRFTHADVSAHAMPLRSEELAKRLKVKPGGGIHIFASPTPSGRILLICRACPGSKQL